ncbi:MAG: hypothetical protein RR246_00955 [Clostridia bacterium]
MIKSILILTALWLFEDIFFTYVLKNKKFLWATYGNMHLFPYGIILFLCVLLPTMGGIFLNFMASKYVKIAASLLMAACVLIYKMFVKKSKDWIFIPPLAINSATTIFLTSKFVYENTMFNNIAMAALSALLAVVSMLSYSGIKTKFLQFKRNKIEKSVCAVCMFLLLALAYYGLKF